MARIFSTATPGVAPTISPPASLALFPSLTNGTDMPEPGRASAVESKLDPGSMYMIAIEAREVSLFLGEAENGLVTRADHLSFNSHKARA